jgi:hypothetical protein
MHAFTEGTNLKKLAFLGSAAGLGLGALLVLHSPTRAADHLDAPAVATNPMADITDVYAWTDETAGKVNLVMDVSPGDPGTGSAARHFGPSILYVFHVTSVDAFPPSTGTETKVICKFASDTSAECWVGTKDYVTGDPSGASGVTSASGKVKLFAGRRSDPFFFNFNGFKDAEAAIITNEGSNGSGLDALKDAAGCPHLLPAAQASALRGLLQEPASASPHFPCAASPADCFVGFDVQSIVLQIDKSLLNQGAHYILGVWASTHSTT